MLRPVFSFFNGCEGGWVRYGRMPVLLQDPTQGSRTTSGSGSAKPLLQQSHARTQRSCAKREHHAKPLLQRRHARTQRVPQSGTSMRNPLQAVKRRSCGYMQPHAHCSAKRDLHTHIAAKSGSTAAPGVMQHTSLRQRKGRTAETGTANPLISNGFAPA